MTPRMWRARLCLALAALLLAACEDGVYSGTLIFEGQHQFGADTRLPGDVALRAGTAEFAAGARVDGAIYVLGGTLVFDGVTGGDLVVLDGKVTLGPQSVIGGDLRLGGGTLARAETSIVRGETVSAALALPAAGQPRPRDWGSQARALLGAVLLASAGGLWARLRPQMPRRISQAAREAWPPALALGLLALLVLPILLVMMAFTIILIPLVFVLGGIILLVLGMGLVALGMRLAQWAAERIGRALSPAWAAFAGTLGLLLLFQLPLVGDVALAAVGLLSFGAVLLTRFGTHAYRLPETVAGHDDLATYARSAFQRDR